MHGADTKQNPRLHQHFFAGGAPCCFSTNSADILEAAQQTFLPADGVLCGDGFHVDILVTDQGSPSGLWNKPYFRGLEHLVVASFGPHDVILFNQLTKSVQARISPALASDVGYWQTTILPLMVGTMGPVCGVTPLHCACLVKGETGILLAGRSGTGKSTLTYALTRMGFKFLSDDWTYFSREEDHVTAWGLPIPAKLLPDTTRFFPELKDYAPIPWLNGETAFSADPVSLCGAQRILRCTPRRIFILERRDGAEAEFIPLAWEKTLQWFEAGVQRLPASLATFRTEQLRMIQLLADRECWILRFSGKPQRVAQELAKFCEDNRPNTSSSTPRRMDARVPDMLRRFTPTPLQCDLHLEVEIIALETNSPMLLKAVRDLAVCANSGQSTTGRILWRIVIESSIEPAQAVLAKLGNTEPMTDLPFISFSDGSFLAFDTEHRIGVGFLSRRALKQQDFVRNSLMMAISTLMQRTSRTEAA